MSEGPVQKRREWDRSIQELADREALHVHTLILPPGISPDDLRLKQGKIVSETSYVTDQFSFPNYRFHGNIHPSLRANPPGDRLVLSPSQSMELGQLLRTTSPPRDPNETDNAGDNSLGVDTAASDIGSALTRSNLPSQLVSPQPMGQQGGPNTETERTTQIGNIYCADETYFDPNCETCQKLHTHADSRSQRPSILSTTTGGRTDQNQRVMLWSKYTYSFPGDYVTHDAAPTTNARKLELVCSTTLYKSISSI
eukprot:Gregarina_sp_Poly_1__3161@NODE_1898_length_3123_cov_53_729385_g246_i1_p1_GENE_NODE_1898_length_3123_cov_53_729385_g246_i1NODE_1898_length_3123_cov_53_729385_g246_i1_p1_ORF_typecomplete_len254_score12_24_NODE_1898_length_3123_cov_53_729385_g246_i111671928